jgi:diacylglycerol O-acyltransferase
MDSSAQAVKGGWGVKRLNGMDAMLLYSETPNLHTHTLKVAIIDASKAEDFDGEFNYEAFRRHLRRRLHLLDPLRYKLVDIPWRLHHPMWLENCEVNLDYHLRRVQVPAPGGRRELDHVIGEVASTPLDRSRPLWEFHFAEGLAGGRFAVIGKVHHALADGVASVNLLARAMDLRDAPTDERDNDDVGVEPTSADLLRAAGRDHVRQIAELPGLLRDATVGFTRVRRRSKERGDHPDLAAAFDAPPTFLNHVVSPQRRFATAALRLADIKATAKALGITINDLVLATAAGGLRKLLLRYDGHADRPIIASVPTATDRSDRVTGNEISGLSISLPVHVADAEERARLVALATQIAKEDHEILGPRLYGQLMAYLPTAIAPAAFRWLGHRDAPNKMMNVAVSSVPGPRERGHFGGAPVSEIYSTGVLSPGAPVNITVWSYVDQLGVAVLTDDQTFKDPHEATDALIEAFAELHSAAGLSDQDTGLDLTAEHALR